MLFGRGSRGGDVYIGFWGDWEPLVGHGRVMGLRFELVGGPDGG